MLSLLAIAALSLVPRYAEAQTQASCLTGFQWAFNSLGQSPCDVAAALGGVCIGTTFTLAPLGTDQVYLGPPSSQANSCRCSSVYYSLLAACSVCQNANYLKWSTYDANCSVVYSSVFPQPIPSNVRVPHYAYLNVETQDEFDPSVAESAGGVESSAIPSSTGIAATSSVRSTGTSTSLPNIGSGGSKKSNAGAIAGGVVGGVVGLAIIAGIVFWILRRKQRPSSPSAFDPAMASSAPMTSQVPMSLTGSSYPSTPAPKVYDPNDPSTFPTNFSSPMPGSGSAGFNSYSTSPDLQPSVQYMSPSFTGNSMQNSIPQARPHYTGAPEL